MASPVFHLRATLIHSWWSSTVSILSLAFDRRMTFGLSEELMDLERQHAEMLRDFRQDVAICRFGSRCVSDSGKLRRE